MGSQDLVGTRDLDVPSQKGRALLVDLLRCPSCAGELKAEVEEYVCLQCRTPYPVKEGIPRFLGSLSEGEQQVNRSFTLEHQRYLDASYLHVTPQLVEQWLEDIRLPRDYFRGRLVLDAGCGSGRWTYAMAQLGATVVAVDFTESGVEMTHKTTVDLDNVVVLQADLFHLPFKPACFDLVVSWGVLHHTPSTKAAFQRITPLVKKGGQLYVMLYEKYNPVKFLFTDIIRWYLRRLPEGRRYRACRSLLIKNRLLYSVLANLMICAPYPESGDSLEVSTRQFGLYDAYSPLFNHLHTRQEVLSWFQEERFHETTLTRPVRYSHWLDVFRRGECGEAIHLRGTRL